MNKLNACSKPGFLLLAFCLLASASGLLHAGTPLKINFQGRLEESGQPAEGAKNFVFKLYDALSAGSLVWTSQAQSVAVTNGVFSVVLETGTPVNLSTAAFAGARYVEITVDGVPLSPRQEMVSAPFALVAQALAADAVVALSSLEKDPSSVSVINTSTNAVDWTQLKNVPAGLADGIDDGGAVTFSTAAIVSGKFSDERVSISTGAFYGGFNAGYQLVQLDISGNLPALDGSALTNVNSAPMSALTAQVNSVAASTGTLTAGLAAVVLSTGPLSNSANWNTAFGWGDHSSAGYVGAAALDSVKASTGSIAAQVNDVAASTGTLTADLAAVVLSTGPLSNSANWNTAFGWGDHSSAGYVGAAALDSVKASTGSIAAQVDGVAASTGTLTADLAAVALSTGSIAAQVNDVAASTGTLTAGLAAVVLSTGPLSNSANWNTAFGWGDHSSAGYVGAAALDSVKASTGSIAAQVDGVAASTGTLTVNLTAVVLSTGSIAAQVNGVAASTGTLTVNLTAVVLSTGSIAAQVNGVAASTGTLTVNLTAVVLSTGSIAAQVNGVAASTGTLTADLAAVVLSTGPLANSGAWSGGISVGGAVTLPIVKISGAGYFDALNAYPLGDGHRTVVADTTDGDIYVSLPDAASVTGRVYTVKNFDPGGTFNVTYITTFAGQTVDDDQVSGIPFDLSGQFDSATLQSDGFNWVVID